MTGASMDKFELVRTPEGDKVKTDMSGTDLLRAPIYNKGIAFTPEERRRFGIEGMLPPQHNDIEPLARHRISFRTFTGAHAAYSSPPTTLGVSSRCCVIRRLSAMSN
jgi:hypothetical protein